MEFSCRRAVFLDRDGVINREVGYVCHPDQLELLPDAANGIARLNRAGFLIIVATNQSAVARGFCSIAQLHAIHARLREILAASGARLDGIYFCPHLPDPRAAPTPATAQECDCRKPATGMIRAAVADFQIGPENSYMIGDSARDIECGRRAGLKTILISSPRAWPEDINPPDFVASSLLDAANWILGK